MISGFTVVRKIGLGYHRIVAFLKEQSCVTFFPKPFPGLKTIQSIHNSFEPNGMDNIKCFLFILGTFMQIVVGLMS